MVGRGERHTTRPFAAGAFEFVVTTDTPGTRELVESVFRDLPAPDSSGRQPEVLSFVSTDPTSDTWIIGGPRTGDRPAPNLGMALNQLMADIKLSALDAEPEYLHLHAAAATKGGQAVIVAAHQNTGKTTTIVHLVQRGWDFVTDEMVRLSPDTDEIGGLAKPVSIKPEGEALVEHLRSGLTPPVERATGACRYVPISASGATMSAGGLPHVVILLRRSMWSESTAGPIAERLHPADAVVALMQETEDAERFGPAALRLATLSASHHCYALTVGTPAETADEIETLFGLEPAEPLEVCVLPPSDALSPGVVSIALGDRAVVHDTASGRIFALDAGGTQVWKQLGGWNVDGKIDVDAPAIRPFVDRLHALGVLAGAA
jgi:hypothetical protein